MTDRDSFPMETASKPESLRSPSRRVFFKGLAAVPLAAAALQGCSERSSSVVRSAPVDSADRYTPTFFHAGEWVFVQAACDRLIPADEFGPGAVELGVPEFIDRHMHTPYACGDIWYMQGPFVEASSSFGYQGRLSLREILRVGMDAMNAHCTRSFDGKTFAQLDHVRQETLLKSAESGELELEGISSQVFFAQLLAETRNGFFADPVHGGNKGMGSWKMIGYPGMRADYTDWVEVRDKPYPLPPVDMAGRRG